MGKQNHQPASPCRCSGFHHSPDTYSKLQSLLPAPCNVISQSVSQQLPPHQAVHLIFWPTSFCGLSHPNSTSHGTFLPLRAAPATARSLSLPVNKGTFPLARRLQLRTGTNGKGNNQPCAHQPALSIPAPACSRSSHAGEEVKVSPSLQPIFRAVSISLPLTLSLVLHRSCS